ncbi:MAG: hypothetical protein ACRDBG_16650 [Waterburya sp.]
MALLLDIDGDGVISFARDSLLISAFLSFKRSDESDTSLAARIDPLITSPTATRNGTQVVQWMNTQVYPLLDIDGSGNLPTYSRDGLLISAYLFYRPISTANDFEIMARFLSSPYATRDINQTISYLDNLYNTNI